MPKRLTKGSLLKGVAQLKRADPKLRQVVLQFGPPPLWQRPEGFGTLVHIILEQQVSIASARATYDRLLKKLVPLTPDGFLTLGDADLRAVGFSRQKTAYGRNLARAVVEGSLDLSALSAMDDDRVRQQLIRIKGIGNWSADIYLLMALGRKDAWPAGDLALALAVQKLNNLGSRPSPDALEALSLPWRPWRAVAARILWHYYLSGPD